jgi:hypothetical protein
MVDSGNNNNGATRSSGATAQYKIVVLGEGNQIPYPNVVIINSICVQLAWESHR